MIVLVVSVARSARRQRPAGGRRARGRRRRAARARPRPRAGRRPRARAGRRRLHRRLHARRRPRPAPRGADRATSRSCSVVAAIPYAAAVGPAAMRARPRRGRCWPGWPCSGPTRSRSPRSSSPRRRPWPRCARRAWSWPRSAHRGGGPPRVPAARVAGACVVVAGAPRSPREVGERQRRWVGRRGSGTRPAARPRYRGVIDTARRRANGAVVPTGPDRHVAKGDRAAAGLPPPAQRRSVARRPASTNARAAPALHSTTERARTHVRSRRGGTPSSIRTTSPPPCRARSGRAGSAS